MIDKLSFKVIVFVTYIKEGKWYRYKNLIYHNQQNQHAFNLNYLYQNTVYFFFLIFVSVESSCLTLLFDLFLFFPLFIHISVYPWTRTDAQIHYTNTHIFIYNNTYAYSRVISWITTKKCNKPKIEVIVAITQKFCASLKYISCTSTKIDFNFVFAYIVVSIWSDIVWFFDT